MTPRPAAAADVGRGLLLLGVFHVHALYALATQLGHTAAADAAWLQMKLLSPHVVLFFALSGMTSQSLPEKHWRLVLQRSLALLLIAAGSHVIGVAIELALWRPVSSPLELLKDLAKPIVYGTGQSTYVAWFFVALAVVRVASFALGSGLRAALFAIAVASAVAAASFLPRVPDNLYEWRHWPAALLAFLIGALIGPGRRVPLLLGLPAAVAGLALTYINRPALFSDGVCLGCEPRFVATPMLGEQGAMPIYLAQELLCLVGLLWLARLLSFGAIGKALAFVGRRSIKLLVLHGWVIVSCYGLVAWLPLPQDGVAWFAAVFVGNTVLHLLLYRWLDRPLSLFLQACRAASLRATSRLRRRPVLRWRNTRPQG